ncbi:phosphopeptide-binding protein [Roseivirga sp. E12]|uniref:phosphopeptide-binding protein n=1 Tax=Roseivirga sp. E12 TaxID=2819237 RepID=UPI001ABD33F9|nr:phosphopeptide-binding protein [Roseivirga sp. E12]MBO3698020.1 phosphopeptide-binding protein [Roseivirga sp. E12]
MKSIALLFIYILVALFLQGCQSLAGAPKIEVIAQERSMVSNGELELLSSLDSLNLKELHLNFRVSNFELGEKTLSKRSELLANSGAGQHIHVLLDDEPYMAKYETGFELQLPEGSHTFLAFLSRSYHESVKTDHSYVIKELTIGTEAQNSKQIDTKGVYYSRPKGSYNLDSDKSPILLDFFLVGTELKDGVKIRALIDGEEFILEKWTPYFIYGITEGVHSISLELIDQDGHWVMGKKNYSGERHFNVKFN